MKCSACGEAFEGRRQARFCSPSCRQQAYRQRKTVTRGKTVTRETVTRIETVTDDLDRLDALGARIQRNETLTEVEIEAGIELCERALDQYERGTDEAFIAVNVLARLETVTRDGTISCDDLG